MLGRYTNHDGESERGQIIVLFALVLVIVLVFTALVVDVGLLRNDRQRLVNGLDAGVLAGAAMLPVDGASSGWEDILDAIEDEISATFPGLVRDVDYFISFRCLIGADPGTGEPMIERDIPSVCSPEGALGGIPRTDPADPDNFDLSDFIGAGPTRSSECDPVLDDVCNVVQVTGAVNTQYHFGPAVGIDEGSTGSVVSSACNGPCGQPVAVPLDVVMIMDRTYSMTTPTNLIPDLKDAGYAVLEAYHPEFQHVALGLIGPSSLNRSCAGSPAGVHGLVIREDSGGPPTYVNSRTNNTTNAQTSLTIQTPNSVDAGDFLIAQITFDGGSSIGTITAPAGWTLIRRTNNGTNIGQALYYRALVADEDVNYQWTFPSTEVIGGIVAYRGVDFAQPFDPNPSAPNPFNPVTAAGSIGTGAIGNNDNPSATGVTTAASRDVRVVGFFGHEDDVDLTDGTFDRRYFRQRNNGSGFQDFAIAAFDEAEDGGATGNMTIDADNNAQWVANLVALRTASEDDLYGTTYGANYTANTPQWIPVELTGTTGEAGVPEIEEAYNDAADDPDTRTLNHNSQIVKAIDCFDSADPWPGTNLHTPIQMAHAYLNEFGRDGVKKGIILETDGIPQPGDVPGAASTTCQTTNTVAAAAKADGIEIFTIGFFRDGDVPRCSESSPNPEPAGSPYFVPGSNNNARVTELLADVGSNTNASANACNASENSDGDNFYCATSGADLTAIFLQVATDLADLKPRLVHIYPIPIVTGVAPNVGLAGGGTGVTISGRYFTGATSVSFGGANVTPTVLNDTTIVVMSPSGTAGNTVDVHVRTPGGVSPANASARFTYSP